MKPLSRRNFLQFTATAAGSIILGRSHAQEERAFPPPTEGVSFFLIGDTHYLAQEENPGALDEISQEYTSRLIDTLNRLPGTRWPEALGNEAIPEPRGVIHAGDLIDSGDMNDPAHQAMQNTELASFASDFGLNGGDGRLRWALHEVYGNHDAPQGKGVVLDEMRKRNERRKDVTKVSPNGVHHSWDWGGVHFINLGLVVGATKAVDRPRVYAPLDSLEFLQTDLTESVGQSGRPVVLTHHVDVARYCIPMEDPMRPPRNEWDFADVAAYHQTLKDYRIAGIFYGHTHARRIFPWDGSPPAKPGTIPTPPPTGISVFNTAKASHFNTPVQAFFHFQITDAEVIAREFATKDGWQNAAWTPETWRFALPT